MDVNLTHAIAANVTLMQPLSQNNSTLWAFVSGAGVTLIVALITAYVSYKIGRENIDASERNTNNTIRATLEATNRTITSTLEGTTKTIEATIENANKAIEQDKFKIQEEERQKIRNKRQEAYSSLMGRKHTMLQYYVSYFTMFIKFISSLRRGKILAFNGIDIESDAIKLVIEHRKKGILAQEELDKANQYIQAKYDSELDKSPEIKESLRTEQRSEEILLEMARSIERFIEVLGRIKILFPTQEVRIITEQIDECLDNLENFELQINQSTKTFDQELRAAIESATSIKADSINTNKKRLEWVRLEESKLDDWISRVVIELKTKLDNKDGLDFKIKKLLEYLEAEIKQEQQNKP